MLDLLKKLADRSGGLTHEDAKELCAAIPSAWYTASCGYARTSESRFAETLSRLFPAFHWRIILDRSGERTRWALTVDDDDPREHYFDSLGGECVHCGKSAREIARIDEVNGDDEFLDQLATQMETERALSQRP